MVLKGRRPSRAHLTGSAYVYLLRCRDRTFYTGWTTDLDRRVARHQAGTGARYTRSRLPVELVYVERLPDRHQARRREWTVRRLSHEEKADLAAGLAIPARDGDR
jgi:putative endonuclease